MSAQSVADALAMAADLARPDAHVLLAHSLGRAPAFLLAWPDAMLTDAQRARYAVLVERRRRGEPVAYIVGKREFWSIDLAVTPATLIPRPETELLIELALACLTENAAARVADIGTGSGAIALAIARERPRCEVVATDICEGALAVAQRNAGSLNVANISFRLGDACAPLEGKFDLIVSNPPYLRADDPHLQEGDLLHEPKSALIGGPRGTEVLERVAREARGVLAPGGWLLMEHGYDQRLYLENLLAELGYTEVADHRDLAGVDRVVVGRLLWPRNGDARHAL